MIDTKLLLLLHLGLMFLASGTVTRDEKCAFQGTLDPVCGTDGKNYLNKHELRCASRSRPGLTVAFRGTCGQSRTTQRQLRTRKVRKIVVPSSLHDVDDKPHIQTSLDY